MPVYEGVIDRYRKFLPVTDDTPDVAMGEGNTPLVRSRRIGPALGCELYFKLEGMNPTGSFKDRGMCVAIAKALEAGSTRVMCASTGNTSASASAYASRYGMEAIVLVPATASTLFLETGSAAFQAWGEPEATFIVSPAPASLALLGLGGLIAGRRRR